MARYAMVIDLERCVGCRACMEACKVENNTPQGSFFMYVFRFEEGDFPNTKVRFLPRPCMHCDNAPCAKVCPVGARFKRTDGLVATDWGRCIGCRYCQVACPYGVNYFNWKHPEANYYLDWKAKELKGVTQGATPPYRNPDLEGASLADRRRIAGGGRVKGVIEKCTFCVHRVEKQLLPACVVACPASALKFGDLDDPQSQVSQLLKKRPSFRLLDSLNTQARVFYTGASPPGPHPRQIEAVKVKE